MAFLAKTKKIDLKAIALEMRIKDAETLSVFELRKAIMGDRNYEEEFIKDFLGVMIEERRRNEEIEERRRNEGIEERRRNEGIEERRRNEEIEERKRKEEIEERTRKEEFELQKIRLENERIRCGKENEAEKFPSKEHAHSKSKFDLHNLLQKFDPKDNDISLYLVLFERQMARVEIKQEFWVSYLIGLLPYDVAKIIAREDEVITNDYAKVKELLLKRYKLSPEKFRQLFMKHYKRSEITWGDFAYELRNYFYEWIHGLKIKGFEELSDLIITDQIKRKVPPDIRDHFVDQWSQFKTPEEIVVKIDDYENLRNLFSKNRREIYSREYVRSNKEFIKENPTDHNNEGGNTSRVNRIPPVPSDQNRRDNYQRIKLKEINKLECYVCGGNHVARNCDKKFGRTKYNEKKENIVIAKVNSDHSNPKIEIQPLKCVTVSIKGQDVDGIIDSGTQIFVANSDFFPEANGEECGKIMLSSAFGEKVEAKLIRTKVSLKSNLFLNHPVECIIAFTDKLSGPALIPPKIYQMLCSSNDYNENSLGETHLSDYENDNIMIQQLEAEGEIFKDRLDQSNGSSDVLAQVNGREDKGLGMDIEDETLNYSDSKKLRYEQVQCHYLENVRKELKCKKGNYILVNDLIYHKDKVVGEPVIQLVLPYHRRDKVLKLAHETVFGGHMGVRKTKERIRYNFYWPNMSRDISKFVLTCKGCQLRRKDKISDRAPITPVTRPEFPFEVVNVDLIGPIEPSSARGHKYVLTMVDQHSRWPEAIPLRSISAKSTCDALLQIFSRTGIPNIVASDQGPNFKSWLTQEFLKRIGSSPRFSCPGYPASNGLVERWNKVLKEMLHHVIREDPRNWDLQIPFLLFAYREVPNSTTGVSPFKLLYGREAKGPLALLKSTWAGEIQLPTKISDSVVDYLQEMKIRMELAAKEASITAARQQKSYGEYFNRRSSEKCFDVGDQVILLIPDSNNKIYARWTGPCEVIKFNPPHSYKVKLSNGAFRNIHVNKMRKYHPRSLAVGVIFEGDQEFGEIYPTPSQSIETMGQFLGKVDLNHLEIKQQQNLVQLLIKHRALFTGKVKVAKVGTHNIKLKSDVARKKPFVYRIPESLKGKVDEQIEELLELGLIEESNAEIAYPIVCVNKKDGSLRMCVDYRNLNAETISDDFPMEQATELIQFIGRANIITTLDLLKGYWAIPMADESKSLTSFKTHRQQYQFKVMSFGLKNASATFQRVMNKALYQYREFSRAYIDDIAIFSKDWDEHLLHLATIFTKLEELNFTVNFQKCVFAKPQIKYLGHIIGSGQHRPDPEKIKAVEQLSRPFSKRDLRSVLGLCNYYRDYIPNYSKLVYPLTELTKKKIPECIPWTEEHDSVFERLKKALVEAPALYTPKPDKPFIIHSDASSIGIAACLSQRVEGKLVPIAYASQKLTKTQQSWSTIEREAFAIVWSLKKFEVWVFGTNIELYTDHNPLPFLTKCAPQSARLQRWAFALQRFNIVITHCPGAKMPHADALSRLV